MSLTQDLLNAEANAANLFTIAEERGYITSGQSEKELNNKMYALAEELFGIKKFWHKRIVRAGANTLLPYAENPPDLILQADDILFFDFGPVFEQWEADFGRTYVLGKDAHKLKLQQDVESAWHQAHKYFVENYATITGAELYNYICNLATELGWQYGNEHSGHLIGIFPHEHLQGEQKTNYICPQNTTLMSASDDSGNPRYWIIEIHFLDVEKQIGGFFEQFAFVE